MSVQAAKDFIQKAKQTESLEHEIAERARNVIDIGKDHGFEFDRDDLAKAMKEHHMDPVGAHQDPDTCCAIF